MCSPGVTIDFVDVEVGRSSSDMDMSESYSWALRRGGRGALGGRMETGIVVDGALVRSVEQAGYVVR